MNAWVLHEAGNIIYEDICEPRPQADEVIVAVRAAGVCGSDIPRIYRDGAHVMPLVPGHEFSGCVVETGSDVSSEWMNKRVGIYPLIPCEKCLPCRQGRHEMCRQYSYLGSRRDGGFAEYVAVPWKNLIELPDNVLYEQAAMLEPMAVAVHAIRRININKTDSVAVCGLGTIGQLMVMFLKERGIDNIYVMGNKEYQYQKVMSQGVSEDNYCDSTLCDAKKWIYERAGCDGADVFFECVGSNETVSLAIDCMAPGGSICMVGNPHSDMLIDKNTYWKILRHQINLTGTWNSSFFAAPDIGCCEAKRTDWEYVLELLAQERIHPEQFISHRYDMAHLEQGMKVMRDKSEDYLKILMQKEV